MKEVRVAVVVFLFSFFFFLEDFLSARRDEVANVYSSGKLLYIPQASIYA